MLLSTLAVALDPAAVGAPQLLVEVATPELGPLPR